jgi:hypothetical protein
MLDMLSQLKKYGFVPDKVTTNIMLKVILRWDNAIDGLKLQAMFNNMVGGGHLPLAKALNDGMVSDESKPCTDTETIRGCILQETHSTFVQDIHQSILRARGRPGSKNSYGIHESSEGTP